MIFIKRLAKTLLTLVACLLVFAGQQTLLAQETDGSVAIEKALADSNFEQAHQLCQKCIADNPNDTNFYRWQAQALFGLDRIAEVPKTLAPIISSRPRSHLLILQRALALSKLGKHDEMMADCERLIQLGNGMGFALAAPLYEANGERLKAVQCYSRLMETYPDSEELADWQFSRAQILVSLNVLDWAASDLNTSIEAKPTPLKLLLLGEINAKAERWEAAEEALQNFNQMTDAQYVGEVRRLNVLLDMNELEKVTVLLQQYEEKYQNSEKLVHISSIKKGLQDQLELQVQIKQAAVLHHRPSGLETGEVIKTREARWKTLKTTSDPAELAELKQLTIGLAQLGMYQSNTKYAQLMLTALSIFEKKVELTAPEQARQATVLAWLQMQEDKYVEAEKTAMKALKLDPKNGDACRVAATILFMTDQNKPARAAIERAVKLDPLNSINQGYCGLIHTSLGNAEEAAASLMEAERLDPSSSWVMGLMENFADTFGLLDISVLYQGQQLKGNYSAGTLDRCELFLNAELPQFAVPDALEYANAAADADLGQVASIVARGGYDWYEQTIAYSNGGPDADQVIEACIKAEKFSPEDPTILVLHGDMLRRQGNFKRAIAVVNKALELSTENAFVFHTLASLQLAVGDIQAAAATKDRVMAMTFTDQRSIALQQEINTMVTLATDLAETLTESNFQSHTGSAVSKILAFPKDIQQAFSPTHAVRLGSFYEKMRPLSSNMESPGKETTLHLECITTEELKAQDSRAFNFDPKLAEIANELSDGKYWFTAHFKSQDADSGPSFGYFVKLTGGWRLLPKPWSTN